MIFVLKVEDNIEREKRWKGHPKSDYFIYI